MTHRKRTQSLTREEILDTALRIIDSEGLAALTMRRLGSALGVDPMMIYRHVPNKEALLDLTVERMRSGMALESLPDNPLDVLETIFTEYRRVLSEHPNMLPLAMRRTDPTGTSGLRFLIDQGLAFNDAVELYQSLAAFTVGFTLLGSPLADGQLTEIPDELAERIRDWRETTFRRTLRAVMHHYGLEKQKKG